ncbi:ABC transporter permease, partial [Actinomyces viscosus]
LLVLPLLDVLFDVLMGSDLSAPDLVRTGYAAALVALAVSVAAGVGVNLPDPYLGATVIATFLPLLTGVIVPLEQCPAWLQALARAVPVSGTLTALDAPNAAVPVLLGRDLAVAAVWAGIGLVVTRRAATRLRQGRRTDTI